MSEITNVWTPSLTTTIIGLFICLVSLVCITGNILALRYFLAHRKTTSGLSYIFLASNDIATLLLLAPIQLSLICGASQIAGSPAACSTWAVLWCISRRLNNFVVMWVLGCRTVSLMSHFKYVRAVNIYGPMISYFALLLLQGLVPIMSNGGYVMDESVGLCDWTYNVLLVSNRTAVRALIVAVDITGFGGPVVADLTMIVSAVVFIKSGLNLITRIN